MEEVWEDEGLVPKLPLFGLQMWACCSEWAPKDAKSERQSCDPNGLHG